MKSWDAINKYDITYYGCYPKLMGLRLADGERARAPVLWWYFSMQATNSLWSHDTNMHCIVIR